MKLLIAVAVQVSMLLVSGGCVTSEHVPSSQKADDSRPVVSVTNTAEFLQAIGSDRIIELAPGTYHVATSEVTGRTGIGLFCGFWLHDLKNLRIQGLGKRHVKILTPNPMNVMGLADVEGVELYNLEIGHDGTGHCLGDCLVINRASNILIKDCVLFGCGYLGLHAERVEHLRVERTMITGCSEAVVLSFCDDVVFNKSRFCENRTGDVLRCYDSFRIQLLDCRIEKNKSKYPNRSNWAFLVVPAGAVEMRGGSIEGNRAAYLLNLKQAVRFEGTSIRGNDFYRGLHDDYTGR